MAVIVGLSSDCRGMPGIVGVKHLGGKTSTERYNPSQMLHPYPQSFGQTWLQPILANIRNCYIMSPEITCIYRQEVSCAARISFCNNSGSAVSD